MSGPEQSAPSSARVGPDIPRVDGVLKRAPAECLQADGELATYRDTGQEGRPDAVAEAPVAAVDYDVSNPLCQRLVPRSELSMKSSTS